MHSTRLAIVVVLALLAVAAPAAAQESAPEPSHVHQIGVSVALGTGYRVLFPYNEEYCGQPGKSVCTGRSPFFFDVGLSYGVSTKVELLASVKLGVEEDFEGPSGNAGPTPLQLAAGARIYVDTDGQLKFFSTLEGVVELTDYSATTQGGGGVSVGDAADWGVRNVNGILFDFHRTFGVYAHFGETATFANWLRFELHGGLGVQARFP
jgi:hypothetical protein